MSRNGRDARREAVRGLLTSARRRLQRSWLQDLAARLKTLDFFNAIVLFGAALLMSVLPLIILLSSASNQRVDDDLSRHLGLSRHGAQIIEGLFRKTPAHEASAIVTGVIVGFAGTLAVASSLQLTYEGVFGLQHRGWRDFPLFVIWAAVLIGALAAQGFYDVPLRSAAGTFVRDLVSFALVASFFMWSMHFLLAGRVAWHHVMLPAFLATVFWLGLALFSTIYFAPAVISEQRLYGTIGVVFVLLTWFIAIGAVVVLGTTLGAVLQERAAGGATKTSGSRPRPPVVVRRLLLRVIASRRRTGVSRGLFRQPGGSSSRGASCRQRLGLRRARRLRHRVPC